MRLINFGFCIFILNQFTFGQTLPIKNQFSTSDLDTPNNYEFYKPKHLEKKSPAYYTKNDWKEIIDSTWGEGLSTSDNLAIFDRAWNLLDQGYGAYMNMYINLDSILEVYRPEIENGVSLGRFTAIMNHLAYAHKDSQTSIDYLPINTLAELKPGIPIFVIGASGYNNHFGAGLTPLSDSSLLVYKALPNHKLNLQAGDIVIGYDGVPWKQLYKNLLKAELPIRNVLIGSSYESNTHILLQSAGLNWHLFDTIDIVKYNTEDTLHLSTQLLENQEGTIIGNEQLPIQGIDFPDITIGEYVSWGIVNGTSVGYIYVWYWYWDLRIHNQFYDAVYDLMNNYETSGLIIDLRVNYGGAMEMAHEGYSLIFNETVEKVAFDERGDPFDHYDMIPSTYNFSSRFAIIGDPNTFYNKPIAVLAGPNTFGSAEWEIVRLKYHPMVRTFGKETNGGFTINDVPLLENPNFSFSRAKGSGYLIENHEYMAHKSAKIDESVWLTKDDVAKGDDTVVKKAIDWINSTVLISNDIDGVDNYICIENNPNPFHQQTEIKYSVAKSSNISIKVYNVLGKEVANILNNEFHRKGKYIKSFDNSNYNLCSGVYTISIEANNMHKTSKMIIN
jgi:peptidase S41-like protein/type IX secretion system substrate protein